MGCRQANACVLGRCAPCILVTRIIWWSPAPVSTNFCKMVTQSTEVACQFNSSTYPGLTQLVNSWFRCVVQVLAYNARHLLRIYPANWRVGSWNFNPCAAWMLGASIAALNWQVRASRRSTGRCVCILSAVSLSALCIPGDLLSRLAAGISTLHGPPPARQKHILVQPIAGGGRGGAFV